MKKLLISLIKFYKRKIFPNKKACCRFRPSCSSYAIGAIEKHGAFLGSLMAIARISRCNIFSPGGFDPVPEKFTLKSSVGKVNEPSVCEKCSKKEVCDGQSCDLLSEN